MSHPIIETKDLNFTYRNEKTPAIKGIDLSIETGECVIITGRSGSGKSTLALVLSGFIPHTIAGKISGSIRIEGIESKSLHISEISQIVGLVQQDPENQLVCPTVLEEIAFGPENLLLKNDVIKQRVNDTIVRLKLEDLALRSTNRLSGGEIQKVAIAAILSMKPKVLIFDEPSSFLDPHSLSRLILTLKDLQKENKTIIIIEHRPELFRSLNKVRNIVLERGRIVSNDRYSKIPMYEQISFESDQKNTMGKDTNILIKVANVNVFYQKWHILRNLDFEIKKGLIYAIVGNNGAGKSTLLQVLTNLIPYQGRIVFKGTDLSKTKVYKLARSIGLIFQNPNHQIFEKSVLDEIFFGPRNFKILDEKMRDRTKYYLRHSNLEQYQSKAPYALSFGEKRRLNYISVEIYQPELLLLDEPFIGQDIDNVVYLTRQIIERKHRGLTTIIVSHRLELLKRLADYFICLDKGRIIWQGTRKEFSEERSLEIMRAM